MPYGVIKGEWIRGVAWESRPYPWVARLTGLDARWGFCRVFVQGVRDYSYVRTKRAGRGIFVYFALAPGLYEVYRPVSWKHEERFFVQVDEQGTVRKIDRERVIECLKNTISE